MVTASSEVQPPSSQEHWLYGSWIDLLVGCCGFYTLSIPFLLAMTMATGTRRWPSVSIVLIALTINAPHYGATLVRLYERKVDRRKYVLFTIHVTFAIGALFVIATRSVWLASALITAYVVWSPWHFSAQNYGLLLMFLRRQGVAFDATTKRLFHASFVFSTGMAIEGVQAMSSDLVFAPATFHAPNMPDVFQWSLLQEFATPLLWTMGLLYLGCLAAALYRMRGSSSQMLGPAAAILITQALFTAVPVAAGRIYTSGEITLAFAPIWISMAHSAQYLWVSAYFAKRSGAQRSSARFLGKSFLAGSGVTVLPAVLFAPALLGTRPTDAGLAASVFAVVNLHHFIMDGAIWKLRDSRVGNILLRDHPSDSNLEIPDSPARRRWLPICVWSVCALSVIVPLTSLYETRIGIPTASRGHRIELAMDRLRWIGRESIGLHNYVGLELSKLNQSALAIEHFERSLELFPTPDAWTAIGSEYRKTARPGQAKDAFDAALAINPDFVDALLNGALVRIADTPEPSLSETAEARRMLERAIELQPGHDAARRLLEGLENRSDD